MEDQIGPDRPEKSEFTKLEEEIIGMEFDEEITMLQNKKTATSIVFIANAIALFFLLLWIALIKDPVYSAATLVSSSLALIIAGILFFVFRHYKLKEGAYRKYLYDNFYALLFLFSALTILSIFKL